MGGALRKFLIVTALDQLFYGSVRRRKRKLDDGSASDDKESVGVGAKSTTKKVKLDTPNYLYQKLFIEGQNSDVLIHALGHTWHLHRVYLEQCDFFRALFQGNWVDSDRNEYELEIVDANISVAGLDSVFASLYNNEIALETRQLGSIVATASMLNLPSVLTQCNKILTTFTSQENILTALQLADRYGFEDRLLQMLDRLQYSFTRFATSSAFLKQLDQHWFAKILSSDTLCVRENELDVYFAIRNILRDDGMIPVEVIDQSVCDQWSSLLATEEATGPFDDQVDDTTFYSFCVRLGRSDIQGCSKTSWRWLGFFFGVDLLVNYEYGFLRLTRNCTVAQNQHQISIKHTESIRLHYRVIVCNDNGDVLLDTQRQSKSFSLDRSVEIGSFKLPKGTFSMHLFYLSHLPVQPPINYWIRGVSEC